MIKKFLFKPCFGIPFIEIVVISSVLFVMDLWFFLNSVNICGICF
jgi:hypothetical protein